LVKLLLSSNVWRYLDFIAVQEAYMHTGKAILEVPCSKKTLLLNKNLAAKEKRQLMKLLQSCMAPKPTPAPAPAPDAASAGADDTGAGSAATETELNKATEAAAAAAAAAEEDIPFGKTLSETHKFSANVCNYVVHAIAGVSYVDWISACA
jgi:hypothetical protein